MWLPRCITVVLVTVLLEIEVYCSTLFFCCFTAIHLRFRRSNDNFDRNSINLSTFFSLSLSRLFCTQILFQLFVYSFLDEIIILTAIKIINDRLIEKRNDRSSSKFVHYYLIKIPSKIKQSLLHCVLDFATSFFKLRFTINYYVKNSTRRSYDRNSFRRCTMGMEPFVEWKYFHTRCTRATAQYVASFIISKFLSNVFLPPRRKITRRSD